MTEAKILIVDDEAGIRFSLEEVLVRTGYQVTTAENGEQAILLNQATPFDLALVDLKLPGIGGLEVLSQLKQQTPDIVIVVLTAHASLDTAVEALRLGAHDYLFKPCKTVELRESIRLGLQKRRQAIQQRAVLQQLEQHLSSSLADIRAATADENSLETIVPSSESMMPSDESGRFIQQGGFIVDPVRHVITLDTQLLELSPTEFNLLAYLISEAPRVISATELVREVQGYESEQREASEIVRHHVYRLRQKIQSASEKVASPSGQTIVTVRGIGYTVKGSND
ncbi:MAG: response regulator transcription factor [Chloroflexota bacterium]